MYVYGRDNRPCQETYSEEEMPLLFHQIHQGQWLSSVHMFVYRELLNIFVTVSLMEPFIVKMSFHPEGNKK